jgi:hypothetical protein
MTFKEAAVVELYTGTCMLTGDNRKYIYEYASKLFGRPVYTHELVSPELVEKAKPDFVRICENLTEDE